MNKLLLLLPLLLWNIVADIAPPQQPPGSNIQPDKANTQVRMQDERIVLDIQPYGDSATASVRGHFTMHNLGTAAETMQVRFPLADPSGFGSGMGDYPEVQGFKANINGKPAATTIITTTNPSESTRPDAQPIRWAAFDATFPAGVDLPITVTYSISATGYAPTARFAYVLETGAGWRDTIGSVDVVARLPYTATVENVLSSQESLLPGYTLVGNEIRWHYNNLEPTHASNIEFSVLAPATWQKILDARAAVEAKPADPAPLVTLATAYDGAITSRYPLQTRDRFALLAEQTYRRAIALEPRSAELHAGYAQMIWDHMTVQAGPPADDPDVLRVLNEVSAALVLDPQNKTALDLYDEMKAIVQGPIALVTPTIPAAPEPGSTQTLPPTTAPIPGTTVLHEGNFPPPPTATSEDSVTVLPVPTPLPPGDTPAPVITAAPSSTPTPAPPPSGFSGTGWLVAVGIVAVGGLLGFALASRRRTR